jgi:hypothetical protein
MNEFSETMFCFYFNLDLKEMKKTKTTAAENSDNNNKTPARRLNGSHKYR